MGWLSSAAKWVKKKVVKPVVSAVTTVATTFVDKVGDVLEAGGNFISGLANTKFGLSGTISGGSGNDLLVGLDFASVGSFLKLSFNSLFSPGFWTGSEPPPSLSDFADSNSNRLILDGKAGNDTIFAFGGLPTVYGGSGNDRILTLGGDNRIYAGADNDFIVAAGIVNTVDAGTGNDTAIVLGGSNTVDGGSGNDVLTVFGGKNDVDGGSGDDVIVVLGLIGSNQINGGLGNDRIFAAGPVNFVKGGGNNDLIVTGGALNVLYGGLGQDTMVGIGASNTMYGDADSGDIFGSGNNDSTGDKDVFVSFGINNNIWAQGGDDVVTAFGGLALAFGGDGEDVIVAIAAGNVLFGGNDDDVIVGLGGGNVISGDAGNDVVVSYGSLDLSFGGDGDDILVGVGIPAIGFQMGGAGQDIIVGVGGTIRIQFGDNPFDFVAGGDPDVTTDRDANKTQYDAQRDGFLGFVEQTILDFQFTDFEFEDLSLPTLPSLDDLDLGAVDAAENFFLGIWDGAKAVWGGLEKVATIFDINAYDRLYNGLEDAFVQLEFDGLNKPNFSNISLNPLGNFGVDVLGFGALEGFASPATPDYGILDTVTADFDAISEATDPGLAAGSLLVPDSGIGGVTIPGFDAVSDPNRSTGFDQGSLDGVASRYPGESLDTSGLPSLAFTDLLDLPDLDLPDVDLLSGDLSSIQLPSGAIVDALGETLSGLAERFELAGLFRVGDGLSAFRLPDLKLPTVSLPSFDLFDPQTGENSDIMASVAGGSFLFGQEDDDLIIGAGFLNMIFGGSGSDILAGVAKGNVISGGQDDDILIGLGLLNIISGGQGSDILGAGGKFNLVAGGTDADILVAGGVANLTLGGSGRDLMGGAGKLNVMAGGAESDIMLGGGKFNLSLGGADADLMAGFGTFNVMLGGTGGDLMIGGGKFNGQFAGEGNDIAIGGGKFNVIDGDVGDDLLVGGGKFNLLYARSGNDALLGGGTYNAFIAGGGTDLLLGGGKFNIFMAGVEDDTDEADHDIVLTAGKYNTFFAGAGDDLAFIGGEVNTVFLGTGDDFAIAFSSNLNFVLGQDGADVILGAGVGNLFAGGLGNDLLFGFGRKEPEENNNNNNNNNTNEKDIRSDGTVDLAGDFGDDLMIAIGQNVTIKGGTGNDKGFAAGALNFLDGGEGYDFLYSALGLSALNGGDGNDIIYSKGTTANLGLPSSLELVFDGGDIQGGKGSDFIWANGLDIEVFGDVGTSVFDPNPDGFDDGPTPDEKDQGDFIVVSGEKSNVYGQGGDDAIFLYGANHRADGGGGDDLLIAFGDDSTILGDSGEDQLLNLGSGLARAKGGAANDLVIGKGYALIDWLSDNGADIWTEFDANVTLALDAMGELIANTVNSFATVSTTDGFQITAFDGTQITSDNVYLGRDGNGDPNNEVIPDADDIKQAEIDRMEAYVFTLIDEFGKDNLGTALATLADPSVGAFAPSYDTVAGDLVQAGVEILSPLGLIPTIGAYSGLVSVELFIAAMDLIPHFEGGAGDDIVAGRLGQSLLLGGADDDTYRKAVGERITLIDEEEEGGTDTLEITAYSTDLLAMGADGLTTGDLTFERFDGNGDGENDDLLITINNGGGDVRSLTVVLNHFSASGLSKVENLVLNDGLGNTTNHSLETLAASAAFSANAQTDSDILGSLISNDVTLLETQLLSDPGQRYDELFNYSNFELEDEAESDAGDDLADLQGVLDTYFATLQTVEPGASTLGKEGLENVLDGEAFDGAPAVTVQAGGQILLQSGGTLQIERFERDGFNRFENLLTGDGSSTDFLSFHAMPGGAVAFEAVARNDVVLKLNGIDQVIENPGVQTALSELNYGGVSSAYTGKFVFAELDLESTDVTQMDERIQVRGVNFDDNGDTVDPLLYLDGSRLDGLGVDVTNMGRLFLAGNADVRLFETQSVIGDDGDQTVDIADAIANFIDLAGGADTVRFSGAGGFVDAGDGDDVFEMPLFSSANRGIYAIGSQGVDTFRPLAPEAGQPISGNAVFEMGSEDIIDLSQIGPEVQIFADGADEFRLEGNGGVARIGWAGTPGMVRWTDGELRQIVNQASSEFTTSNLPPAQGIGNVQVLAGNVGATLRGSSGDDVFLIDARSGAISVGDGDDLVVVETTDDFISFNINLSQDENRVISYADSSAQLLRIYFPDNGVLRYRLVDGFDERSWINVQNGEVTTVQGFFNVTGYRDVDGVYQNVTYDNLAIVTPSQDLVIDEDTPVDFTVDTPTTTLTPGAQARIRVTEGTGEFRLISDGTLLEDGMVFDPADLTDITFVPTANTNGPDGIALLEIEYFDDRGPLDRRDVSIEITAIEDPILFGVDGQPIEDERDFVLLNQNGNRSDRLGVANFSMPTTALTAEMILNSPPATQDHALMSYAVSGSTNEWLLIANGGFLRLIVNGSGIHDTPIALDDLFDGTDHHLAITWESGTGLVEFFIDGVSVHSADLSGVFEDAMTTGGYLAFGQDQDAVNGGYQASQAYLGGFSEIHIYDTVLSSTDIQDRAQSGSTSPAPAGLVHSWSVDGFNREIVTNTGDTLSDVGGVLWEDGIALAPTVVNEGDDLSALSLIFSDNDRDLDTPGTYFELFLDAGGTGAVLNTPNGTGTSFFINSFNDVAPFLAGTTIELPDDDTFGEVTLRLVATDPITVLSTTISHDVIIQPVDDPEFFKNVPVGVKTFNENASTYMFYDDISGSNPRLSINTVDENEDGVYRVQVSYPMGGVQPTTGWTYFSTPEGNYREHSGGAQQSLGFYVEETGLLGFSMMGTLAQLNDAINEWRIFSSGNFEGEVPLIFDLYKVTGDPGTRDPATFEVVGDELQDSFQRDMEVLPGQNAPVVDRYREIFVTADAGEVSLENQTHSDPDFDVDNQPDFLTRVNRLPTYGELRMADGTPVTLFQDLTDAEWAGLRYYVDPTLADIGSRSIVDFFYYIPRPANPAYGITTSTVVQRIRIVDDKEEVPDGSGGTTINTVGGSFINFDSTIGQVDGSIRTEISNSILFGGDGNDYFEPRMGIDMILGGAGADTFLIDENSGALNVIGDFEIGVDILDFGSLAIQELIEEIVFDDANDAEINDSVPDTRLILTNGAELILEDVTGLLAQFNVAPLGVEDAYTVSEFTFFDIGSPPSVSGNVTDNDSDQNGDSFTLDLTKTIDPLHGTLVIDANGNFTYTPDQNFSGEGANDGTDTFWYVLTDGTDEGRATRVDITVTQNLLNGTDDIDVIEAPADSVGYMLAGNGADDVLIGSNGRDTFSGGEGADYFVTQTNGFPGSFETFTGTFDEFDGDTIYDLGFRNNIIITDTAITSLEVTEVDGNRFLVMRAGDRTSTIKLGEGTADSGLFRYESVTEEDGSENTFIVTNFPRDVILYEGDDRFQIGVDTVENATYGGRGNDVLIGNVGMQGLIGGLGDDVLFGLDDLDSLFGGPGINVLTGGAGADYFYFHGKDFSESTGDPDQPLEVQIITDFNASEFDQITLRGFGAGTQQTLGTEYISLPGGTLILPRGDHRGIFLQGVQASEFTVPITFRDDRGQIDAVSYNVDADLSRNSEITGPTTLLTQDAGDNVVEGLAGDDSLGGGAGDDTLRGLDGNDTLLGGEGDDVLNGGQGLNVLIGGSGADIFELTDVTDPAGVRDTIKDFELGLDAIRLAVPGIDTLDDAILTNTDAGLEFDLGGGRSLVLEGFTATENFSTSDIEVIAGTGPAPASAPTADPGPALEDPLPSFDLVGYSIPLGRLIGARELSSLGVELTLETPLFIDLEDENGRLSGAPGLGSLFVGDDDQGTVTQITRLTVTPDGGTTLLDFIVLERSNLPDALLIAFDAGSGRTLTSDPGLDGTYSVVSSSPLDAELWLTNLLTGTNDPSLLTGTEFADDIIGGDADDELLGLLGPDKLSGGLGSDSLRGGEGNDLLIGDDAQLPANTSLPSIEDLLGGPDHFFF